MNAVKDNSMMNDIAVHGDGDVIGWLKKNNTSLVFSCYQPGKLFLIGRTPEDRLLVTHRNFDLCMGMTIDDNQNLYLASLYQIWKLTNILPRGELFEGFDRLYCPQVSYITGETSNHDMGVDLKGNIYFVNTLFSCISAVSTDHSFKIIWQPKFLKDVGPGDHCHLNGLAMVNHKPKYVTMFCTSPEREGWRKAPLNSGLIVDITNNEVVCDNLIKPHSPRVYRNTLYVLNSGTGEFGYVDKINKKFVPMTFCPGFTRGLSFIGDYAIVGLSKVKEPDHKNDALPLNDNLKAHGFEEDQCGICMIDLKTGKIECSIEFSSPIMNFIYDVLPLKNSSRPLAIGLEHDHVRRAISVPPDQVKNKTTKPYFIIEQIRQVPHLDKETK